MDNNLKIGFARTDITPPLGIEMTGYFIERKAKTVLDPLEINAIAISDGKNTCVLMTVDDEGMLTYVSKDIREKACALTGVPVDSVFIQSTHSHTTGKIETPDKAVTEQEKEHYEQVLSGAVKVIKESLADLKPAKAGYAVAKCEGVSFGRIYVMKDGSVQTNPGVCNPDVVKPLGKADDRVNVIRFDRESDSSVLLVNFGNHPDTIGGERISADWVGFARRKTEKALDNVKCIVLNGALGDINHVKVNPSGGDLNGMIHDFDDVWRGYKHAEHLGNALCGSVMQVYEKVFYNDVESVSYIQKFVKVPLNKPLPEEMGEARYINGMHLSGRDEELPYKGMMLTTKVADAERKIQLENAPDTEELLLSAIKIGDVAIIGFPGEPFNEIGLRVKKTKGWEMVLPCSMMNGNDGYFPMQDTFDEGGYEAGSSRYKAGVGELLANKAKIILKKLKERK